MNAIPLLEDETDYPDSDGAEERNRALEEELARLRRTLGGS